MLLPGFTGLGHAGRFGLGWAVSMRLKVIKTTCIRGISYYSAQIFNSIFTPLFVLGAHLYFQIALIHFWTGACLRAFSLVEFYVLYITFSVINETSPPLLPCPEFCSLAFFQSCNNS